MIRAVALSACLLVSAGIAAPQIACAQDVERVTTPAPANTAVTETATGWQVETRPLWRLQLGAGAVGADLAGGAGGFPLLQGGAGPRTTDSRVDAGTSIGYQYGLSDDDREAVGINLQLGPDAKDAYERLLLQPGLEYHTPLMSGLQLNARVFSTYASDASASDRADLSRSGNDSGAATGFRDVGLGVGFDYSVTERWVVKTQAGVSRQLDETRSGTSADNPNSINQFFGGVVVNYRF